MRPKIPSWCPWLLIAPASIAAGITLAVLTPGNPFNQETQPPPQPARTEFTRIVTGSDNVEIWDKDSARISFEREDGDLQFRFVGVERIESYSTDGGKFQMETPTLRITVETK